MARKCSSCGNNGHNSRTCSGHRGTESGGGGVRLFGVHLHVGSSSPPSPMTMKKCFSVECLSSSPAPARYAAGLARASSSSPTSSSLVSVDETAEKVTSNGYLSDGLVGRAAQARRKGVPWSEDEHRGFLAGLEKLGKGDWRGISRHFVTTRTPTQVASHAQKHFLRQGGLTQKRRRSSLFDVVENGGEEATSVNGRVKFRDETISIMSETEFPALSLGSSSRPKPEHALAPRCPAATSSSTLLPTDLAPRHPSIGMSKPPPVSLQAPDLELKISLDGPADRSGRPVAEDTVSGDHQGHVIEMTMHQGGDERKICRRPFARLDQVKKAEGFC